MFTFLEMLALVWSESSFGAYVCHRRPAGLHSDQLSCCILHRAWCEDRRRVLACVLSLLGMEPMKVVVCCQWLFHSCWWFSSALFFKLLVPLFDLRDGCCTNPFRRSQARCAWSGPWFFWCFPGGWSRGSKRGTSRSGSQPGSRASFRRRASQEVRNAELSAFLL